VLELDDLFPPEAYGWLLWLPLPLFLVLLALWILLSRRIARRTLRRRPQPAQAQAPVVWTPPADPTGAARGRIDDVERRVEAGELDVRDAHLELSGIVREWAWATSHLDARTMTLAELRSAGLWRVADAVAGWYPMAFAPEEVSHARRAIAEAREVVG